MFDNVLPFVVDVAWWAARAGGLRVLAVVGSYRDRCLDVRLKEGAGASESLVAFVEDGGEGLKDVGDFGGDVQDDGDVVGRRSGRQPGGVVKQDLV
jgi:hypothetical protein